MLKQSRRWWKFLQSGQRKGILAGLAAHFGQISVGLSQGFSAILVPTLLETNFADQSEVSWIASLGVVSNPLGALIAGLCAEFYGRRSAIALATLPHVTGWLLIALSKDVAMLCVGRFISGIGTGMANGLYLYVSEAAAPNQRAWLASSGPVLVSLGVLIVYTLGAITTWQSVAAISIGPAILSLALARMLPETPAWLAARGRLDDAKASLLWLRGPGLTTDVEFQQLCSANEQREQEKEGLAKALHMPNVWKPFLILFVFFLLQQLSGIYVILFYAVSVLEDIGVNINEYAGSVGIGVIRLFAAIIGAGLANCFGRRWLAFTSGFGMAMSAAGAALSFRLTLQSWIPLACIAMHVGSSMLGFLTLPWVMTSELYPLRFRGSLGGLTTSIAQILTFVAVKTFPGLDASLGLETIMWAFGAAGLLGAVFSLFLLPETRGRSLDDIERKFSQQKRSKEAGLHGIFSQPTNITLQKFTSISEEKEQSFVGGVYAYNNYALDLSFDRVENGRAVKDQQNEERRQNAASLVMNSIFLDRIYI